MPEYPEWMHEEFAKQIGVKGARITDVGFDGIKFEADICLKVEEPQTRIANIRMPDA